MDLHIGCALETPGTLLKHIDRSVLQLYSDFIYPWGPWALVFIFDSQRFWCLARVENHWEYDLKYHREFHDFWTDLEMQKSRVRL